MYDLYRIASHFLAFSLFVIIVFGNCSGLSGQVSSKQRQEIRKIKTIIDRAGKQYQAKRYDEAAEAVKEANKQLRDLLANPTKELLELAAPEYERIKTAFQLLREQGQSLEQLADLPQPPRDAGDVSFINDVIPILTSKCGGCHVDRASGRFSLANYQAIAEGRGITPGQPETSRLIEVIESGEMPQGGARVTEAELTTLKAWVIAGAKFDGDNPATGLRATARTDQPEQVANDLVMATGNETVSFSADIAPMLVENCSGCHVEARNVRGGLNMTTFRMLLQGGDNGRLYEPGKGSESLLVRKLRGTGGGQRMPAGRPALTEEQIATFTKWIDEGAKFDGRAANIPVQQVAALSRAERMSHEELATDRSARALAEWQLVLNDDEPTRHETSSFFAMSQRNEKLSQQYAELAESLVPKIATELRLENQSEFVKGRITLFIFQRRYDYSEFGKMIESRDLPTHFTSHWGHNTLSAYVVIVILHNPRDGFDERQSRVALARSVAALAIRDHASDVPKWFADGVGFNVAKRMFSRDEAVRTWDEQGLAAFNSMSNADDFVMNRMAEDKAALVSYLFVASLMKEKGKFSRLLDNIKKTASFQTSFRDVYGASPQELISAFYGDNRRRDR